MLVMSGSASVLLLEVTPVPVSFFLPSVEVVPFIASRRYQICICFVFCRIFVCEILCYLALRYLLITPGWYLFTTQCSHRFIHVCFVMNLVVHFETL